MKVFRFSLRAVLTMREVEMKRAQNDYQKAQELLMRFETRKANLLEKEESFEDAVRAARTNGFRAQYQENFLMSGSLFAAEMNQLEKQIEAAKQNVDVIFQKYLKAKFAFEKLEEMKERKKKEHFAEETKKEERELEDRYRTNLRTI